MVVLAGGGLALAETAATVAGSATAQTYNGVSVGWRFFVDTQITITHLGLFDQGDDGLAFTHKIGIWRLPKTGGFDGPLRVANIGPGAVSGGDGHVYVDIEDITLVPDPEPSPAGYYERWLIGVWSPVGNTDGTLITPLSAVTMDVIDAGYIHWELAGGYTYDVDGPTTDLAEPWGGTVWGTHWGINFQYTVASAPVADAGPDLEIYTSEQALTVIAGTATDPDGDSMQYRWVEGTTVLQDWAAVGADGAAALNLASVPAFSVGVHSLTLEVSDETYTSTASMQLTVCNTPPDVQPAPTYQLLEINADAIVVTADVADFDGDMLSYEWIKDGELLGSGNASPPVGGAVVSIPDLTIAAGDPRFPLGVNIVELRVADSTNPAVSKTVEVEIQDTGAPTLAPTASHTLLWPPNHELHAVTIWANAEDNGGGPITLTADVECSEDDGGAEPDCYVESVDNATGIILVQLRAERSGTGEGRVYTVTITATDESLNESTAVVEIRVPHDRRKK
jgi:hypothetical protein